MVGLARALRSVCVGVCALKLKVLTRKCVFSSPLSVCGTVSVSSPSLCCSTALVLIKI